MTGASSGIGLETAKVFAARGCRVVLGARGVIGDAIYDEMIGSSIHL